MVLIKIAAILIFCLRRGARDQHGQLASVHAQRILRRADRRGHRLLHLHRLRFGLDRGRGMQEPAARPAVRHLSTLVVCTILYAAVALVLTGIAQLEDAEQRRAGRDALKAARLSTASELVVTRRRAVGMFSSLLVFQYGQARIWFAMSRDGLLPPLFSRRASSDSRRRTSAPGSRASSWAFRPASGTSARSPISRTSARCSPSSSSRRE